MTHFFRFSFLLSVLLCAKFSSAQWIMINKGGGNPDSTAALQVQSNNRGLLIPRMTQAERNAIDGAAQGLLIYQTDQDTGFYFYKGNTWLNVAQGLDNDSDSTNELQSLSLNGNVLSISSGNSISIASASSPWIDSISSINTPRTVGIGTSTPDTNASLQLANKPFLLPRFTTDEMLALPNPADGMLVYNTTLNCLNQYNGTEWLNFCNQSMVQGATSAEAPSFTFRGSQGGSVGTDRLDYLWVDENQGFNAVFISGASPAIFGSSFSSGSIFNARTDTAGNDLSLTSTRLLFAPSAMATEDTLRRRALRAFAVNSNSTSNIQAFEGSLLADSESPLYTLFFAGVGTTVLAIEATNSNHYLLYNRSSGGNPRGLILHKRSGNNADLGSITVSTSIRFNFGAMTTSKRHLFTMSSSGQFSDGQLNSFLDDNTTPSVIGTGTMDGIAPAAIAADTASNLYFLGNANVVAILAGEIMPLAPGYVLAKLNETLNSVEWAVRLPPEATPKDVAVSQNGEVYVCGWYSGTANFGTTTVSSTTGFVEPFLAKYSTDGTHLFTRVGTANSGDNNVGLSMFVRVNAFGQVAVAGSYSSPSLSFGGEAFTNPGGTSVYLWVN